MAKRGASTAACGVMPKTRRFSRTCSIAWTWTSPPGLPNGITLPSAAKAMAGFGVSRGRLPGATADGWPGTPQDWQPRVDGTSPVPGTTGASNALSLGVAETALPSRSTTQI